MKKQDFKKNYPDVCVQEVEFQYTLSRKAIEDKVLQMVEFLDTGLLGYESDGRKITAFISDAFARKLQTMAKGGQVLDENTRLVGTIVSEVPFICGRSMCVRVDFGNTTDVYECTYFK